MILATSVCVSRLFFRASFSRSIVSPLSCTVIYSTMFYGKTQGAINVYGKITVNLLTSVLGYAITTVKNVNVCNGNVKGGEESAEIAGMAAEKLGADRFQRPYTNRCIIGNNHSFAASVRSVVPNATSMGSHTLLSQSSFRRRLSLRWKSSNACIPCGVMV